MSKSKGNVISLIEVKEKYSADVFRFYMSTSTTLDGTFNWRNEDAINVKKMLTKLYETLSNVIKERKKGKLPNKSLSFISKFERTIKESTEHLDKMELREYGTQVVYGLMNGLRKTQRRLSKEELSIVYDYVIDKWVRLLCPIVPHIAEELWSKLGNKGYCSTATWPKYDSKKINEKAEFMEEIVSNLISDINEVKKLAKVDQIKEVKLIVAYNWKYQFIKKLKKELENTRNTGRIIKAVMDKEHGKEISKLVPMLVQNQQRIPQIVLTQKQELEAVKENLKIIEKEFNCKASIAIAEKSQENKKNNALPGKPAILII